MVRESHVWLAVLVFACWFVVVLCPGLHTVYLCALALALLAIPAAGLVALVLTIGDYLRPVTQLRHLRLKRWRSNYGQAPARWHVTHGPLIAVELRALLRHPRRALRYLITDAEIDT